MYVYMQWLGSFYQSHKFRHNHKKFVSSLPIWIHHIMIVINVISLYMIITLSLSAFGVLIQQPARYD